MVLFVIGAVISLYEFFSLLIPLKISWAYRLFGAALIFTVSCRNSIFQKIGGGMFFAPELPLWLLLLGAWLYSAFFFTFFLLVVKDVIWLLWKIFVHTRPFPRGAASCVVLSAAMVLALYGTWGAMRVPDVEPREVVIERLPKELDGLKIALLADLHISAMNTEPLIRAIVDKTNSLEPDVILLNGDMIDGTVANREKDSAPLGLLRAKYGVYGSTGNHEYYSGYGEWSAKLAELGIKMLDNAHATLDINSGKITIAGVTDKMGGIYGTGGPDIGAALNGAPADVPVILMAHRPEDAKTNAAAGVDLQLSGHTHGGMALGFDKFIARFNGGYVRGWYDVNGMKLYVSPGTLLWNGFALRLGVPSEITLFILRAN